jgi:hypothetical protein
MTKTIPRPPNGRFRIRAGLLIASLGFILFLIGAIPGVFGLDRSTIIGLVQIGVFLIGLGFLCIGGYICMSGLWSNVPKSIIADIGLRLVSTGYVIAFTSGMADVIGFGSQRSPEIPFFGLRQMQGVIVGEAVIALGFLLLIPYRLRRRGLRRSTFIPPR